MSDPTGGRNWDAEMRRIDRNLESVSDSALLPAPALSASPAAKAEAAVTRERTRTAGAFLRLALAVALGVGVLFWPYEHYCGAGLAGYLGAVLAVAAGGVWSAFWTWRHRTARAHVLALLLVLWGITLAAVEVLPRAGYGPVGTGTASTWACS